MPQFDSFNKVDIVPGARFERRVGKGLALSDAVPQPVTNTPSAGTGTLASRDDHSHAGVHSIAVNGGAAQLGDVALTIPTATSNKGIIRLPLVDANIDAQLRTLILTPVAGFEVAAIKWDTLSNLHDARWATPLRDDVAVVNNQKLVIVSVETVAENAKNWKLDVYTGSVGTGGLLSAFAWSAATTVTINSTNGLYAEHITTVALNDAAFADNKEYFVKLVGKSQTAAIAFYLTDLYITYDQD